jgi:short-subunit dehydrogenase
MRPQFLSDAFEGRSLEVEILVNNAGVGYKGKVLEQSVDDHLEMNH